MSFPISYYTPVLLLAYVLVAVATSLSTNESITGDARSARVTGRIVKLYSGSKPEPIVCVGEGYQVDPADCAVFYRCVKSDKKKYTVFRFQCGPGTFYDPETEVCNHPKSTKRSECNSFIAPDTPHHKPGHEGENEIDFYVTQELPSPIKVNKPVYVDHNTIKRNDVSSTAIPWISSTLQTPSAIKLSPTSTTMSFKPAIIKSDQQAGDECTSDGFMGDSKNCHVFYRCVGNGRGGFTRYQFSCSDDTIWDDDVQNCNYPSFAKRIRCGRSSDTAKVNDGTRQQLDENLSIPSIQQLNYGSKVSKIQKQTNNGTAIQNQTQISHDSVVIQTQAQINHENKAAQTQVKVDHTQQASQQQQAASYGSNDDEMITKNNYKQNKPQETAVTQSSQSNNSGNICTSSGFMGDTDDCRKFYRCVDNGKGSFTRYEFSCGDGTVWDSSIEACNHAWAVTSCGQKTPIESSSSTVSVTSEVTSTTAITETTTRPQITTEQLTTEDEDDDTSYGNQNQATSTNNKPTTESLSSQGTTKGPKPDGTKCTQSGFIGDSSDCKKFYRCVDNGRGSYTRYEFTCGEGTVWDSEIDGCNHAWAVSKCGGTSTNVHQIAETTTTTTTIGDNGDQFQVTSKPTSISTSQTTENDVNDYDTGYGQSQSSSGPSSTATTKQPQTQQPNEDSICKSNGFMGDAHDCKKFYRCVDNGNGEFTRYEFSCGEGTVWDNSIDACNHAWAVKSCQTGADQISQTQTEAVTPEITTSESGTSELSHTSAATSSPASEITSTTQISSKSPESDKVCTSEGFKGDSMDCKKFYRCVDNGKGSYTRYEFTCGEGTVWDSEIQGCNHQTSSNRCGSSQTSPNIITEQTSQLPEMENDEMNTETTSKTTTDSSQMTIHTSTTEKPQSFSGKCDSEGFYGNRNDCKKFYRCVDNGKGGYTKYDFNCGEGTVWDQEIQACNHPKDNQNCTQSSSSTSHTTEVYQENTTESHETTETSTSSSMTTSSSSNQGKCSSEGFFANPSECKKFYRCVSDNKGGYTKYDFACGEGTVWVQEIQACDHDNEVNSCSAQSSSTDPQVTNEVSSSTNQPQTSEQPDQQTTATYTFTTTESQTQADQNPNQSSTSSSHSNSGQCSSEGFYANENDCTKFYRCVENGKGGYTKYDFACGEGTAWDSNIQACNHVNDVNCNINSSENQYKPETQQDETFGSTESTGNTGGTGSTGSTTTTSTSGPSTQSSEGTGSSMPNNDDKCTEEGYFGNSKNCKKFYRCVDNGKGSYTKYDFDCGEGTIWDQDIIACNHPRDVNNPSCKEGEEGPSSSSTTTTSSSPETSAQTTTQSLSQTTSSSTTESNAQESSNCSQENTSNKPENKNVNCTKEGFYGDPDDCKKFYRCVDWDGNGQRFSVYHFECGEGTIWDPSLDTCNHEDSVYPSRDCSGTQNQSANVDNEYSTTMSTTTKQDEKTTTDQGTTVQSQSTTEKEQSSTTEQQQTTQESTTQSTTSKQTTTQKSTTQDSTTTEQTTTTQKGEKTTTQQSTTEKSTTEQETSEGTTSQQSTTEQTTTSQQSTTEQTTTTQQSTTEQTTTKQSTTSEQTSTQSNTGDQSTTEHSTTSEPSTTEQISTTEQSTTEENTTQQTETEQSSESTTQSSTTQESTTQQDQGSTTESKESTTTEGSTESSSQKECPDTESDQYLYVCPTGFRRHPKYCNLFYQCTEDNDTHEVKIATFNCPNNTIYDENKTQCVEENKAEKKCNGEIAQKRRFKRLDADAPQPMVVSKQKHSCPSAGHYPFEKEDECSPAFLKCEQSKSEKIRGFVYRCPNNFVYWSVSRRCEPVSKLRNCKESVNDWSKRFEIPVERSNVAR